ncbi:hypothetical protein [Vibrio superstes]|uniref:Uncharacterized protein n=1 Tax=Vibrio superstes NBRC 103154 TaxID=1219062 RepID=A0A511QMF1_9VIBR|nr:hypothetical protein [Vibrio superstes]GEM78508.1 hypothetical protein VSU01S_07530 [Vibrio superstes NBRC 103154]
MKTFNTLQITLLCETDLSQLNSYPLMLVPGGIKIGTPYPDLGAMLAASTLVTPNRYLVSIDEEHLRVCLLRGEFLEEWVLFALISDSDGKRYGLMKMEHVTRYRLKSASR